MNKTLKILLSVLTIATLTTPLYAEGNAALTGYELLPMNANPLPVTVQGTFCLVPSDSTVRNFLTSPTPAGAHARLLISKIPSLAGSMCPLAVRTVKVKPLDCGDDCRTACETAGDTCDKPCYGDDGSDVGCLEDCLITELQCVRGCGGGGSCDD